ncbi:MAG: TetR/AcrR family transcriptional regulator C-terminal domain-containing protein, partial [Streptomyces sp.]
GWARARPARERPSGSRRPPVPVPRPPSCAAPPSSPSTYDTRGPESHRPAIAGALRELADRGRLTVPDMEAAVLQLYSLLVFPHLVLGSYGTDISDDLTDRPIVVGVAMFLGFYASA